MKKYIKNIKSHFLLLSIIIADLFYFLICSLSIEDLFSKIYTKMNNFPEGEDLRFDHNQICTYEPEVSKFMEILYNNNQKKYICFVNKTIYVLISESNTSILHKFNYLISNIDLDNYYDFTVFKDQNNEQIIFYITYFDFQKIYISSIIKTKDNSKSLEEYKYNESLNIFGQSISCKFVFDNLYNLCFFIDENNLLVASLINPINKSISIQSSAEGKKFLRYIKSTYIKKIQQIFICGTDYNALISCIIYDIRKNKFNEWIDLEETLDEQLPEKIQTYYFKETENIIFFISYEDYAISYSIDEKGDLIKSGECVFSQRNFIFLFLSWGSSKNYELISDLYDKIICNINSTIIPNITIEPSSINSNIILNKSTRLSIPTSFILSTTYNYLYSTYQYSKTSLLFSSNILISKESSLITQTSLLSPSNILISRESSLIKSTSFSSTSFLIDKSSTNLRYSTQLITSSTLPITFNNHSSLLIYTSLAINSNSKISDKINSFPITYTSYLTIVFSSIPKIEIIKEEIITDKINITKENLENFYFLFLIAKM